MRPLFACAALAGGLLLQPAFAADHLVIQKDKKFAVNELNIKVGDKVTFRNEDTLAHNIFSLSDLMSFDLGTYGPGQSKELVFPKPGKVEVECAIHPGMKMTVNVRP
jgi:plastocyanin